MDDLISRQWLMECFEEGWIKFDTEKDESKFIHLIRDIAPSIEPEIIHCKDCKHYVLHVLFGRQLGLCERLCDEFDSTTMLTEGEDFCSHAERRKQ